MPSTKKPPARSSVRPRAIGTTRARLEKNDHAIGRIAESLETAQKDLATIGGSVGTGASDLRKDVAKLLRDARRDITKMSKTVRRDVERLQKDLSPSHRAKRRPAPSRAKSGTASRTRRKVV